uniref:Uncharacterized protein n=1 Tax=Heliothis virescens TaxID=7102 RepID=A0A2A4J3M6_HELVI
MDLINQEILEELSIHAADPNYESRHAQNMIDLLEDIKHYEESIILNKVIIIMDKGLQRMKDSDYPFGTEIAELTRLRGELAKNLGKRRVMCAAARRICEEVTRETRNQRLRLEIQHKRFIDNAAIEIQQNIE